MANVLNRTSREYLVSVNDPDYPVEDWIHNPDLSAVAGFPPRYWVISGDDVTLMDQSARDAVDASTRSSYLDSVADQFDEVDSVMRAFGEVLVDELNQRADRLNAILDAADNAANLAAFKSSMAAIQDYPQRTLAQLKSALRSKM